MPSLSLQKVWIVARHELDEAVASRLLLFVLVLYLAGSSLACGLFLKGFEQAEFQVRRTLASEMNLPLAEIPPHLVREKAVPALLELVGDPELRAVLTEMPLFATFYTLVALSSVAALVLAISAGSHASDLASGSARFVLVRCDRFTWSVGKFAGQALVLLLGLLAGGVAAGAMGVWLDEQFDPSTWPWLGRATLAAWVYGLAYLGIFCAISMQTRTAMKARMLSLLALIAVGILHALLTSDFLIEKVPGIELTRFLFPSHYKHGLWLNSEATVVSVVALGGMGMLWVWAGTSLFARRDA